MFDVQLKMDRFVTRKRKPGEIGEGESSGAIASEKRSVTNTQQFEEQEKQKQANRKFHAEWEDLYFVSGYKDIAICLICRHVMLFLLIHSK